MKRPEHAVAAFRKLRDSVPNARLWVIGDGPLLERLQGEGAPGVELLGRVSGEELRERLARAHVHAATAVREGWGLNVSEAAACGTPSIGYAVPGLVDSIRASGGALVDPNPAALAEALGRFFGGELELRPTVSTVPWEDVATLVEQRLSEAARRA